MAALLIGGGTPAAYAGACAITETGPGSAASVTNAATINCIVINNGFTVTGSVSNAGTITATTTETGITITTGAAVLGGISNSGTISAGNNGIFVGGRAVNRRVADDLDLRRRHHQLRHDRGGRLRHFGRRQRVPAPARR